MSSRTPGRCGSAASTPGGSAGCCPPRLLVMVGDLPVFSCSSVGRAAALGDRRRRASRAALLRQLALHRLQPATTSPPTWTRARSCTSGRSRSRSSTTSWFPLLLLLLSRVPRGVRRRGHAGCPRHPAGGLAGRPAGAHARADTDRAYYGTDTRLYQLLAGALLTTWLSRHLRRPSPRVAHAAALLGFAGIVLLGSGLPPLGPSGRGVGDGGLGAAARRPRARRGQPARAAAGDPGAGPSGHGSPTAPTCGTGR